MKLTFSDFSYVIDDTVGYLQYFNNFFATLIVTSWFFNEEKQKMVHHSMKLT